ncbi:MAG: cation:proton antiporter [Pseudomonadales bacterium]|nr:cation:proton antiporter [Halieaceae bacterium]MCP5164124.1 cation:proton antiporter [Pseudomonadales bacterium]MCP5190498.1 cation:proton antiporter [Pseudomonadales bacterium]MCP5203800.1 cation:proton antiporter [Pseudomonadales bacterium]
MTRKTRLLWLTVAAATLPALAWASGASEMFTQHTLLLIVMITLADWCGWLFERLGMPELVGQIFAGIILGNLALAGVDVDVADMLRSSHFMQYSAELAVVLLLFLVGLESNMGDLLRVGPNATKVAVVGVALPVFMGVGVWHLLGQGDGVEGWFVGAMLAATSVGITAGMLGAAGLLESSSTKVILGAAVIDDVLGVMLLAVLASVVITGDFSALDLVWIVAKAVGFFLVTLFLGRKFMPQIIHVTSMNHHASFWTGFSLCLALTAAQLAAFAGLAPLIGAFVAGLLLDDVHFVVGDDFQKKRVEELLQPITNIMLTIFFVGIGAQVELQTLLDPGALKIIGSLLLVAVVSKGLSGFTVTGKGFDRLGIGLGMIPRGEVGLVFASFAFSHKVFCCEVYSALVMVVLLTTIAGPLLLKPRLKYF